MEEEKSIPKPAPSNEIIITVKCDDDLTVKTATTFKDIKNNTWGNIKEKAINKITTKENFEIKEWRINDNKGQVLQDTYKFEKDEIVFAVSTRKVVKYIVKHYQENIEDDEFTLKENEEKTGEAGENTSAETKRYEDLTSQPFNQVKINQDGSTVVKIKYKRNRVFLILDLDGGKTTTTLKDGENAKKLLEGKFGANVKVEGLSKTNFTFEKWKPELPTIFPSSSPATVYTASWIVSSEITYTTDGVNFTMKRIDSVQDAVLGDNDLSDNKGHNVSLSSYYIGETEVTQELWKAVIGNTPSKFSDSVKNPVENVTWFDCVEFCNKLTSKVMSKEDCVYTIEGSSVTADFSKKGFKLPTEAEWEYATMAGSKNKYAGCNENSELGGYAWFNINSKSKTHEVGTKKANKYGLYDMSGNVWEWCWDWYKNSTPSECKDPTGPNSGSIHVERGGGWNNGALYCVRAIRRGLQPDKSLNFLGLRLVCRTSE